MKKQIKQLLISLFLLASATCLSFYVYSHAEERSSLKAEKRSKENIKKVGAKSYGAKENFYTISDYDGFYIETKKVITETLYAKMFYTNETRRFIQINSIESINVRIGYLPMLLSFLFCYLIISFYKNKSDIFFLGPILIPVCVILLIFMFVEIFQYRIVPETIIAIYIALIFMLTTGIQLFLKQNLFYVLLTILIGTSIIYYLVTPVFLVGSILGITIAYFYFFGNKSLDDFLKKLYVS